MTIQADQVADDPVSELNERVFFWPLPDDDFDPLAHPEKLRKFGLPALPDPIQRPERHRFWYLMYSQPLKWVHAQIAPEPPVQSVRPSSGQWGIPPTLYESSRNWSGLYITPRDGQMFSEVRGMWKVTEISLPPGNEGQPPDVFHSSTWIGLDGQRAYHNSSLPQIGAEQFLQGESVAGGLPTFRVITRAFWQWWSREKPDKSRPLPLPVNPRDTVMCALLVLSESWVRFFMKNVCSGHMLSVFDVKVPRSDPPLTVSGATAEWVMERSTNPTTDILEELPEYTPISFSHCGAESAARPGRPGQDRTLIGARRITMRKIVDRATRTAPISRPSSIIPPEEQEAQSFELYFVKP